MKRTRFILARPAAELKMISRSEDLRLAIDGKPWGFIRPDSGRPAERYVGLALLLLTCLGVGVLVVQSAGSPHQPWLFAVCGLASIAAIAGFIWCRFRERSHRLNGELAARAIRKEMARSAANDRLFALVYRDAGSCLELLAFFQEGNGAQRLETVRAPRVGDGSKHTETDPRVLRSRLAHYFSVAQIDDLNVVQLGVPRATTLTERLQQRA